MGRPMHIVYSCEIQARSFSAFTFVLCLVIIVKMRQLSIHANVARCNNSRCECKKVEQQQPRKKEIRIYITDVTFFEIVSSDSACNALVLLTSCTFFTFQFELFGPGRVQHCTGSIWPQPEYKRLHFCIRSQDGVRSSKFPTVCDVLCSPYILY